MKYPVIAMIEVTLPIRTGGGLNDRKHWAIRAKETKRHRSAAHLAVISEMNRTGAPVRGHKGLFVVTVTRHSSGTLDDDNLQGSLKAIRDGIADAMWIDDGSDRIEWRYAQAKAKRGTYTVTIRIESALQASGGSVD